MQKQEQYIFLDYQCTDGLAGTEIIIPRIYSVTDFQECVQEFWGLPAGFFRCLLTCVEKLTLEERLSLSPWW